MHGVAPVRTRSRGSHAHGVHTQICAIKSPGFGDRRRGYLEDISVLTGGTFITEQLGLSLESMTPEMLGRAARVAVAKDRTTMIATGEHTEEVGERIKVRSIRATHTHD